MQSLFVFPLFACLVSSVCLLVLFLPQCCCLLSVDVVYISLLLCCGALLLVWRPV